MRISRLIVIPWTFAMIVSALPAGADLYKWVDENGVTNYSNQPPSDPKAARHLVPIDDRVSVYTPDRGLAQAVNDFRRGVDRRAAQRIRALEQELEAERRANQVVVSTVPLVADPCPGGYGFDPCSSGAYHPYIAPVVIPLPVHRWPRKIPQVQLTPGATAGNVIGIEGFIPGNSAAVSPRTAPSSRLLLDALPGRAR